MQETNTWNSYRYIMHQLIQLLLLQIFQIKPIPFQDDVSYHLLQFPLHVPSFVSKQLIHLWQWLIIVIHNVSMLN